MAELVSPARRAAYEVLLRVFEQDAYADRVFRTAARGLDERERAFAQRLAYGSVQRVRTLDHAIDVLGKRPTRKLDPQVRAALRLGAYQLGYTDTAPHAAANESVELVRRARLERAVPFTNAVMRRLAAGIRSLLDELPEGPLKESYPDWVYETFVRDLGLDDAVALMRAMNEPLEVVVRLVRGDAPGEPTDVQGAYRVTRVDDLGGRRGPDLAAEPRLAARRARARLAGRRARARPLRRARRQDRAAEGDGDRGRGGREPRERAAREPSPVAAQRRARRRGRRDDSAARADRLRPGSRRRARARVSACSRNAPTCAGVPSRCRSSSSRSSAQRRSA